jgi:Zn-dependent protease
MFDRGYITLFKWRGAPVRFHWTIPLGAFVFGRFAFVPAFWAAFVFLVFIHEMGHALFVRRCRLPLLGVDVHGLGGQCRHGGDPSPGQRSFIAWGGVLAQLILLLVTQLWVWSIDPLKNPHALQIVSAFTFTNLWLMAINLMPIPPLDGAEAWKGLGLWRAARRRRVKAQKKEKEAMKKAEAIQAELHRLESLDHEAVAHGNRDDEVAGVLGRIAREVNEEGPVQ